MSTNNEMASDPVSEFLAREQHVLAELGDDFVAPPSPPPNNGDDLLTNGGSNFGSGANLNVLDSANDGQTPFVNGTYGGRNGPTEFSHSRSQSQQPEEEPEKIRKWRQQQKEMIAEKDKIEEKKKEELRIQASKELEQFYAQRKAQLEQRKKLNREREAALQADGSPKSQDSSGGVVWERVARMIEGSAGGTGGVGGGKGGAKSGQSATGGGATPGKDTSRMKQLILSYARGEAGEKSPSPEVPKKDSDM